MPGETPLAKLSRSTSRHEPVQRYHTGDRQAGENAIKNRDEHHSKKGTHDLPIAQHGVPRDALRHADQINDHGWKNVVDDQGRNVDANSGRAVPARPKQGSWSAAATMAAHTDCEAAP